MKFHLVIMFSRVKFICLLFLAISCNSSISMSFSKLLMSILEMVNAMFFFNSAFCFSSSAFYSSKSFCFLVKSCSSMFRLAA